MFTGIVDEIGKIAYSETRNLVISAKDVLSGMSLGSSIAVNGVCLTVTDFTSSSFTVDVMPETLGRTNLGFLHTGDKVNLESPLSFGGALGGHLVQGHVDATGRVAEITPGGEATFIRITAPSEVMRFTVSKGFTAVDGISLTIVDKDNNSFRVSVVDYTRKNTTLGSKQVGDMVNLEIDITAKYIAEFNRTPGTSITYDFLEDHGFLVK
ncbi:riboflavin synthase [Chloroflexota bacterium]